MKGKCVLFSLVTFNILNSYVLGNLVIETTEGLVRGKLNNYENFVYYSYQGIPYAESPSGKLRFKPPVPKKPWKHILDATRNGAVCPQSPMPYKYEQMSEDCLLINVYVPKCSKQEQLPVLVFIHGGGLVSLSGGSDYVYGPQFFLQREIIVVTLNYRLGPLGFFCLDINQASGNAGIKDILLGLKWVRKNINKFGGNKNKITIGGNSSGAALVHYLLLMKQSEGLFQRAILISGSALNHRFISLHPRDAALSLANELGITSKDDNIILKELQKTDVFEIIQAFRNLSRLDTNVLKPCNLFAPCVEKNFPHAVITENPWFTLEKSGLIQNIPILVGSNAQEGVYLVPDILKQPNAFEKLYTMNELCIPSNIEYPEGSSESRRLGNLISNMYFCENSEKTNVDKIVNLASDIRYAYSVYAGIKLHKQHPKSNKVYFYNFNFDGDLNWSKLTYNIDYPGTSHSDELGYLFVTNVTINRINNATSESKNMINVMVNRFSDFIKFGAPENYYVPWPEFDLKDQKYLELSKNSTVHTLLNSSQKTRFNFWDNEYHLYKQYVDEGGNLQNRCRV